MINKILFALLIICLLLFFIATYNSITFGRYTNICCVQSCNDNLYKCMKKCSYN